MAYVHEAGEYLDDGYEPELEDVSTSSANTLTWITNVFGALLSIALIAGLCIWGYRLVQRDVTGIPVVRAAEGEMRVRPSDPGGQLANNQGLAVNAIAAQSGTEEPAESLVLAPPPPNLSKDDLPQHTPGAAPVQQPEPLNIAAALETGQIDTLVARLTTDAEPLLSEDAVQPKRIKVAPTKPVAAVAAQPKPEIIPASVPGVAWSKRPSLRPASFPVAPAPAPKPVATAPQEIDPASIPSGTRLVQLGAFDSAETARTEWARFEGRFAEYMSGKDRVIEKASTGGRTFYRLRAHGFADLNDARQFCAVLVSRNADCIPVVTR